MAVGWYNGGVEDKYLEYAEIGAPAKSGEYIYQGYKYDIRQDVYDAWKANRFPHKDALRHSALKHGPS